MITRREFLRIAGISAGLYLTRDMLLRNTAEAQALKPRIVVVRNPKIRDEKGNFVPIQLQRTVNQALRTLFQIERGAQAIAKIVTPQDKVGLKIQCYRGKDDGKDITTHPELVDALIYFFRENRFEDNNIIVWDDDLVQLEKSGYKLNRTGRGVRYLATRHKKPRNEGIESIIGFDESEVTAGKVTTKLAKILTKLTTVTVNMPVLKTHQRNEVLMVDCAMLNMFGAIEKTDKNTTELYKNECNPAAADIYSLPAIKNKTKLILCDALTPLYNGGPMDNAKYHTNYNGIIVGLDPVAVDAVGQGILQKIRDDKFGKDAAKLKTKYLETASSDKYKLGTSDLKWIEMNEITI